MMTVLRSIQVAASVLLFSTSAAAQTGSQQMPPAPKPGPEQAVLKMDEGTWDAVVEFVLGPGQPPQTSKGVEVNTMGCGGMCSIASFKGEAMGMPFEGHGVVAWDAKKKKYTGIWVDSMSTGPSFTEATYNAATKKLTGTMEGPDMTGNVMKTRNVVEWKDANTRVMTAFAPGPDGKEMQVMKITYTRRK
jgi:hypothetical protein